MKSFLLFLVTILCIPIFCVGWCVGFVCRPFIYGYLFGYTLIETSEREELENVFQEYLDVNEMNNISTKDDES